MKTCLLFTLLVLVSVCTASLLNGGLHNLQSRYHQHRQNRRTMDLQPHERLRRNFLQSHTWCPEAGSGSDIYVPCPLEECFWSFYDSIYSVMGEPHIVYKKRQLQTCAGPLKVLESCIAGNLTTTAICHCDDWTLREVVQLRKNPALFDELNCGWMNVPTMPPMLDDSMISGLDFCKSMVSCKEDAAKDCVCKVQDLLYMGQESALPDAEMCLKTIQQGSKDKLQGCGPNRELLEITPEALEMYYKLDMNGCLGDSPAVCNCPFPKLLECKKKPDEVIAEVAAFVQCMVESMKSTPCEGVITKPSVLAQDLLKVNKKECDIIDEIDKLKDATCKPGGGSAGKSTLKRFEKAWLDSIFKSGKRGFFNKH